MLRFSIILTILFAFTHCEFQVFNDNLLESVQDESNSILIQEDESILIRCANSYITDTEKADSYIDGDDGSYTDTPYTNNLENKMNVNGDGHDLVYDNVTKLTWTRCSMMAGYNIDSTDNCSGINTTYTNYNAVWYGCRNINYGGYNDWRVPTVHELMSIVNLKSSTSRVDETYFPNTQKAQYWTRIASTFLNSNIYYFLDFSTSGDGETKFVQLTSDTAMKYYVRCVR